MNKNGILYDKARQRLKTAASREITKLYKAFNNALITPSEFFSLSARLENKHKGIEKIIIRRFLLNNEKTRAF